MNIYEALKKDHQKVQHLLDELERASTSDKETWKKVLDQIRMELIPHSRAEEAVFYNALRETKEGKGVIAESYGEHAMAEGELRTLGAAKMVDSTWTSLTKKLRKDLNHHIEEEEGKVFATAKNIFSDEEARQIGEAFEKLKPALVKDADSILSSTVDMVANLLPRRLMETFRKGFTRSSPKKSAA